jgi:diketogulonate reductase-like aldo/keto reductase
MHYSLLGRDMERDIIPMMRRFGLGLTVWSPLASGFLSGKYRRENLPDPDNRYSGFDILPFDKEHGFKVVEKMQGIAANHNATVAQVAVAWLLSREAVTSVLIGATKRSQLEDNLKGRIWASSMRRRHWHPSIPTGLSRTSSTSRSPKLSGLGRSGDGDHAVSLGCWVAAKP